MSRFSDLIDQVADQKNYSLSDVLLRAKVLASKLPGRKFRQWLNSEVNGYDKKAELPDYRVLGSLIIGNFAGYGGAYQTKVPLATALLEPKFRTLFSEQRLIDSVGTIEGLLARDQDHFEQPLELIFVEYLRKHSTQMSGFILNQAFKVISKHAVVGVVGSVRSRLLDFLLELSDKHPELTSDDSAITRMSETDVDSALIQRVYHHCNIVEGAEVNDIYQAGQAGAMGPNAKAENMNFIQVLRDGIGKHSLGELANELATLRDALLSEAKNVEQDAAVADVAAAEEAAKKGDAKGVLSRLKSAGAWAFDVATKIGTAVAAKAVEKSMGLS